MASLLNENQPTDPISLLPYKKPTRVLPCGHTFNHSSLASLLDNNNGDATLACPVCRKRSHVRGVNEYPRNYGMEQQMDFQQEKEDKIRKEKMDLVIKTKCPTKWVIEDLETGQKYRANGQKEIGKMFTPIDLK